MVVETVDLVKFDGTMALDEVTEHATTSYRGELSGIPDQDHPPVVLVGEAFYLVSGQKLTFFLLVDLLRG